MKKRFLACTLGIILSLSLVMTSLVDVRAEETGADAQSQEVSAGVEELAEAQDSEEVTVEEEIEAKQPEEIVPEQTEPEEIIEEIPEEEGKAEKSNAQTEKKNSEEKLETMTVAGEAEAFEERTPTFTNPVSKVEYILASDGNYELKVTLSSLKTLYKSQQDLIRGVGVTSRSAEDGRCFMAVEDYYDGEDEFVFQSSIKYAETIKPGERFYVEVYFVDGDIQASDTQKVKLGMEKVYFTAPGFTTGGYSGTFTKAEPGIRYNGMPNVNLEFESASNLYILREDMSTGFLKLLNEGQPPYYNFYEDGTKESLEFSKNYRYYLLKNNWYSDTALKTKLIEGVTISSLSDAEKTVLKDSCSNPVCVTTLGPKVAKVTGITCSSSLESATVTWWTTDTEGDANATGYEIYQNNKLVQKYAKRSYDGQITVNLRIPYVGVQKFKIRPYFIIDGKTYYGDWSAETGCESSKIKSSTLLVTKINSNKVRIIITNGSGITGNDVYMSSGSSWKKIKSNVGGAFYYSAKKAGSQKYRVVGFRYTGGKRYYASSSAAAKPRANIKKGTQFSSSAESYAYGTARMHMLKIYYSGGKLKISGYLYNSRYLTLKRSKVKITVYSAEGKKIASQTFKYNKKMTAMKKKKVTFTFKKAKKDYDLTDSRIYMTVYPTWF